jgi:hypothetical protein
MSMRAESATRQLSIAFQTDKALTAYGALAAAVENYGFDAVTVYNDMLYQPSTAVGDGDAAHHARHWPVNPARHINIAGNI